MSTDTAGQLTQLYVKLEAIDSSLSKLALLSDMNTRQIALNTSITSLASEVSTLTAQVENLELSISALLTQLRSL